MSLFLHQELNLGCIFDTAGCRAPLASSRVDKYFDLRIISSGSYFA